MEKSKKNKSVTVHMMVKNEDQFIWYAIQSVLPYVDKIIITDTGSSDKTLPIVSLIKSDKIILKKLETNDRKELIDIRNQNIADTNTDWILLVDGDEVWGKINIKKLIKAINEATANVYGIVNETRNCVGDIYHYQNHHAGKYKILGKTGHYTIRAIRNVRGLAVEGAYPNEKYVINGNGIQNLNRNLITCDTWYLHATHLQRSSDYVASQNTVDRLNKFKLELGIKFEENEIPEVFAINDIPPAIPRPQDHRIEGARKIIAWIISLMKNIKRTLV